MFAYCNCSPASLSDTSGNAPHPCFVAINDGGSAFPFEPNPNNTPDEQTNGVINGQALLPYAHESCGSLGKYSHNGCVPIAVYNSMQLIGIHLSLQSITDYFADGRMLVGGLLGVGYWEVDNFYDEYGVEYIESNSLDVLTCDITEGTVITFVAWLPGGWHGMCAVYTRGNYWVYNYSNQSKKTQIYSSLDQAYSEGWLIYGYRIDP